MDDETAYHLLCDESESNGTYFGDFYGGVLVGASQIRRIEDALRERKVALGFHGEVKWSKVTGLYLDRYQALMNTFFDFLRAGELKLRIMFRPHALVPTGLTPAQHEDRYFILYYLFIKFAFGFAHRPRRGHGFHLHLWFDQFPDKREKVERFKRYLQRLPRQTELYASGLHIHSRHITEVDSHDHALLQCLDIVLGAMAFRLNDRHKEKAPETGKRGKRTIAKEALYRSILAEIYTLKPGFNIGITTGCQQWPEDRWRMPYRHWRFAPKQSRYDASRTKSSPGNKTPGQTYYGPGA